MTRRIDAHHHFWKVARGDYHWMPESGPLHHDYLPEQLAPLVEAAAIDGTILVQAAQTVGETRFLLELAEDSGTNRVLGVVGWVPLDSESAEADLEALAGYSKAVAVRPMLHDLPDADWLTRPQVIQTLHRVPSLGLCLDVLSYPEHLPFVLRAIDKIPDLKVVIDHLSKPRYTEGVNKDWHDSITQFAKNPRVYCKLSGMVTEVGPNWTVDDFRAHSEVVLESFGPDRVMFGSDWPVCLQVASYKDVVRLTDELTSHLSPTECAEVWGLSAARFYDV